MAKTPVPPMAEPARRAIQRMINEADYQKRKREQESQQLQSALKPLLEHVQALQQVPLLPKRFLHSELKNDPALPDVLRLSLVLRPTRTNAAVATVDAGDEDDETDTANDCLLTVIRVLCKPDSDQYRYRLPGSGDMKLQGVVDKMYTVLLPHVDVEAAKAWWATASNPAAPPVPTVSAKPPERKRLIGKPKL